MFLFANEPKTRKISIKSGFENVGNALRQSLKWSTKNQSKQDTITLICYCKGWDNG